MRSAHLTRTDERGSEWSRADQSMHRKQAGGMQIGVKTPTSPCPFLPGGPLKEETATKKRNGLGGVRVAGARKDVHECLS